MELNFSLDDIRTIAKEFIAATAAYKVFALHGEMGAGKTTFVHAVCEAMGVQDSVTSPTFSLINEYRSGEGKTIYHMDLYRIKDEAEAINAGIEDCLYSGNTCLAEWPEKAPGIFPDNTLHVTIQIIAGGQRKISW